MRITSVVQAVLLVSALSAPLAAQSGMAGMDMTTKINGSGKLPDGWMLRWDSGTPAMTEIEMKQMGTALHFRSGPAAIYYNPKNVARGEYTVSANFSQARTMQHESYGLFIAGANLQDATQNYLYFVVRPSDGAILISHRSGNVAPTAIVPMTPDDAVNKDNASTGATSNVLAIRVSKDSLHFYANGRQVRSLAKTALNGMSTDGIAGIRVNHNLDIEVDGFGIKK